MTAEPSPFVICSTPRSGSYLVCNILEKTGLVGIPAEYYTNQSIQHYMKAWGVPSFEEYIECLPNRASAGGKHYGLKIMAQLWPKAAERIRETKNWPSLSDDEVLLELFPGAKFIFLNRRDKVRQAISLYKALQTGIWAVRTPEHEKRIAEIDHIPFSYNKIAELRDMLKESDGYWLRFFTRNDMDPMSFSYEDFCSDIDGMTRRIFRHIGLPENTPVPTPGMKKQASMIDKQLRDSFDRSRWWMEPVYQIRRLFKIK